MLNTAYSIKAFEPRLNSILGKGPYSPFCGYAIPSGYGMEEGKFDQPMDFLLDERPYYDCKGDLDRAPCGTHKNSLLVMGSSFCRQAIK